MTSAFSLFAALLVAQSPAPQSPPPAVAAGDSAYRASRFADALTSYEKALVAQPANLGLHVKAGYSALALNKLDAARAHFRVVVSGAPNGAPVAKAGLAMIAGREGQTAQSLALLDSAVTAGYPNYDILDREKGFDKVRKDPQFVRARDRAAGLAMPCMGDSASRAFDFWIGDWDVYVTGGGPLAGHNVIERIAGGCALLENWTAVSGVFNGPPSDGKSMNFVDPATGLWKQVWMGSGKGQTDYVNGKFADGVMRFTTSRRNPQGVEVIGRFAFFNLGPNKVRQFQESSSDGGKTYVTNYDFIYVRRGSGEKP